VAEKSNEPTVSLSRYQPSREASGLDLMAKPMYEAFMTALRENDQTGESLRFPVVGVLEGRVGHIGRPGIEKAPSIELRFVAVEPVLDRDTIDLAEKLRGLLSELNDVVGENAEGQKLLDLMHEALPGKPTETVVGLMHQLRDVRLGEQPLDLDGTGTRDPGEPGPDGERPATGGETTTRRPRKRAASGPVVAVDFSSTE
jgi:hypothetical protein